MLIDIYQDFQESVNQIKELMQIDAHKMILRRMKIMVRLMKNKKEELDDMRHQSNSKQFIKELYKKYNI